MAISAIANSGSQAPTLASLLQIKRVDPISGRDSDDAKEASASLLPKVGAKQSVTPKLVQNVLKTLNQMGATFSANGLDGVASESGQAKDIKKTAADFLSSVISAIKPQSDSSVSKSAASSLDQLKAGVTKMIGEVASGSQVDAGVAQAANQLLKASGLPSNSNTLGGLLEGIQKSLMDDSGSGSLINLTA